MVVYVMRHGKTFWNEKQIIQGRSSNRLSKVGKEQVNLLAQKLKDVKFDCIISSPIYRTKQSSNIINKYHNCKIILDSRITEKDQGKLTGKKFSSLNQTLLTAYNNQDSDFGIESNEQIFKRTKEFYNYIKKEYAFKTILIVTHGIVASYLELIFTNKDTMQNIQKGENTFLNAQIKKFEL